MKIQYLRIGLILVACVLVYIVISVTLTGFLPLESTPVIPSPGPSDTEARNLTQKNITDPPLALGPWKNQTVVQGSLFRFTLNRTDLKGRILVYEAGPLPGGAIFFPRNYTLLWTPDVSQSGVFAINFTARNKTLTTSRKVFITVKKGEQLPDPINMTLKNFFDPTGRPAPLSRGYPEGFDAARHPVVRQGGSIQAAVDSAGGGDIVVVEEGIYPETVVISKPMILWGQGNPVIDGGGRGSPLSINADGVTVDGFSLRNSGPSLYASGIKISSNRNIIANTTCVGNQYGISLIPPTEGNRFLGNRILNNSYSGLYIPNSRNIDIQSNTIVNNGIGIEIEKSWYLAISENTVSFNKGDGIKLNFSHFNQINNNIVMNNKGSGIFLFQGGKNRIIGNYIGKNSGNGIETRDFVESTLVGNQIITSQDSLSLNFIENNTVMNQKGHGIVANRTNNLINDNEIGYNNYGIYFISSQNLAMNNNMKGNSFGMYLRNSGNSSVVRNYIQGNANGIKVDGKSGNNEFISNVISDNRVDGLTLVKSAEHNTLRENIIANNTGRGLVNFGNNVLYDNVILNNTLNG